MLCLDEVHSWPLRESLGERLSWQCPCGVDLDVDRWMLFEVIELEADG